MEKRVLVVDDDQVVGKSFERVLTNKGYRVDTALSGREAFENEHELACRLSYSIFNRDRNDIPSLPRFRSE